MPPPARAGRRRRGTAPGTGRRGNSPSWRPQTKTARKRRARIASGSASSTPAGGAPAGRRSGTRDRRDGSRTPTAPSASRTRAARRASAGVGGRQAGAARRRPRAGRRRRARRRGPPAASTSARRRCGAVQIASASASSARRSGSAPSAAASASASSATSGGPPRRDSQTARGGARAAQLAAAHAQPRARRPAPGSASRPGVRSHVSRSAAVAAGQRGARARQHTGAEPRAGERHAAVVADRDAVAGEHLREQRGRAGVAAQQHRDVGRLDPLAHQLEHRGADELGLGALAAGLQQPHRAVRRAPDADRARTASARGGAARGAPTAA